MNDDYLWDRSGEPDADVRRIERLLGPYRYRRPSSSDWMGDAARPGRRRYIAPFAIAASIALLIALTRPPNAGLHPGTPPTAAGWTVERISGTALIEKRRIDSTGRLNVGDWLVTQVDARARITVADIGHVDVAPRTHVRLKETRDAARPAHRIELARGRIDATIYAPPRLFIVDTPSAQAVDLGCIYSLEVDERGDGVLQVTLGWVELNGAGRRAWVPRGARCRTRVGVGPGTPYFDDAPAALLAALRELDFTASAEGKLEQVLAHARPRDTLALWNLLPRVEAAARGRVFDRIAGLCALPDSVRRGDVMRLDADALEALKDALTRLW